ncbi:MAG: DNA polymerase III subunit gamma/tau [Patescibacteria group bacterium]
MTVLYRKYRPRTFAEVAGQEHVKAALANEAATGHVAHSYLFSGPRGVGKTSIARIFAKAINCGARAKDGDPCGACAPCVEISEGRALDVIEIDAASNTGVDNVREQVIEHARFAPSSLAYKVFIIDEVHMLSTSAFNALLKTLEEPPAKVVFILATTELHKLPATVVSRCQRFDFRKIDHRRMTARLERLAADEGFSVDADVLETVARMSEGCLRDAESLLSQVFALGQKKVTAETAALVLPIVPAQASSDLLAFMYARDAASTLARWEAMMEGGIDPIRAVVALSEAARETLLRLVRGESPEGAPSVADAAALLDRLVRTHNEMKRLDPPEIGFELLLVEWCAAHAERPQEPPPRPPAPPARSEPAVPTPAEAGAQRSTVSESTVPEKRSASDVPLATIKEKWTEILAASQKRNHGLPYMLGAAELLDSSAGVLTVGFQYAMYRDRLNDRKHRDVFEAAIMDVLGERVAVKTILVAQRTDGLVEPSPQIHVETTAKNLPDGFADLVKEFGGTVA